MLFSSFITFSQTIKPLSSFRTDKQPSSIEEVTIPVYYKDINNYFNQFLGTWISQIGSNTFVVTFWKETKLPIKDNDYGILYYRDEIFGHYKLVQNYGTSNETNIYTSQINFLNSPTAIPTAIYATSRSYNKLGATIYDINTMSEQKYWGVRGSLEMIISNTMPNTSTWKISASEEVNPGNFVIPTNITLTKQ